MKLCSAFQIDDQNLEQAAGLKLMMNQEEHILVMILNLKKQC